MHADWLTGVDKENVLRRKNWRKKKCKKNVKRNSSKFQKLNLLLCDWLTDLD